MNMTVEEKVVQEMGAISDLIVNGAHQKALNRLRDLVAENRENRRVEFHKVGFLVDIGLGLGNSDIVREGIAQGDRLLKDPYLKNRELVCYNTANGYAALFQLEYDRSGGVEQVVDNENQQKCKYLLREALKGANHLDSDLRKQTWTNYGNCLDSLGRTVEAFYAYDEALSIDSEFPMALGNKAIAVTFFADISGAYREAMYIKSYQMLKSALARRDLVTFGGIEAKKRFKDEVRRIEQLFKDKSVLSRSLEHPPYDTTHATGFEEFYLDFCSDHKLFLNLHVHEEKCESSIVDPIFISLITPIDDNETFYELSKHVNQIKEDYAVARLLLVLSQFRRQDLDRISTRTTFANTLDYSIFNIYVGLLKSAFKEAYSILDKLAVFVNEYYDIGLKEKDVHFYSTRDYRCVWREKHRARDKVVQSKNPSLYALYDIFLDFDSNHYKRSQDIRNALVHRKLVVYDSALTDWDNREDVHNVGYESMLSETVRLLRLVRSAIVYLINFVQLEERRKAQDSTGPFPPMYVNTTQLL